MRRFELIDGKSSKFWEVSVAGTELTVTFGRIGTNGQTKSKTFATETAALAEEAKLIREKTGKGYGEVGENQPAKPAAPAPTEPKPAPPQIKAEPVIAAESDTAPAPAESPAEAPTPAPAAEVPEIEYPSGGFDWDAKLRALLPVVRGIHVPEFTPPVDHLAELPWFVETPFSLNENLRQARREGTWGHSPRGAIPWKPREAIEKQQPEPLRAGDRAAWRELFVQCVIRSAYGNEKKPYLVWALESAIAAHSLAFATERMLDLADDAVGHAYQASIAPIFLHLRHALAAAPADQHAAALAAADTRRGQTANRDCVISFLFPEQAEWAEQAAVGEFGEDQAWWLDTTVLSAKTAGLLYIRRDVYFSEQLPALLLQVNLHGEGALHILHGLLVQAPWEEYRLMEIGFGYLLWIMARLRTERLPMALVQRAELRDVRHTLDQLAEHWPAAVLQSAIRWCVLRQRRFAEEQELGRADPEKLASDKLRCALLDEWTRRLVRRHPVAVEQVRVHGDDEERAYLDAVRLAPPPFGEAPEDALPELLRNPPWTRKERPKPLPALELAPLETADAMVWPEGLRERWQRYDPRPRMMEELAYARRREPDLKPEVFALRPFIVPEAYERVINGRPPQPDEILPANKRYPGPIFLLSDQAAMALWNHLSPDHWRVYDGGIVKALVGRFELRCLPGLAAYADADPENALPAILPIRAACLAPAVARALKHLKKSRPDAVAWLRAHPEAAISGLLPDAFGKDKAVRDNARHALLWLAGKGNEAEVRRIAAAYGDAAAEAVDALLRADPALSAPARIRPLPAFFSPAVLPRPLLRDGRALPAFAVDYLGQMLLISKLNAPYGGLETVKSVCTPESLGTFAWELFRIWESEDAPAKESWAFEALGHLGDTVAARKLAALIRVWPTEGRSGRAANGLDILVAMGHDGALAELNAIAHKVKSKPLQQKAQEKLRQLADELGMSAAELADRLIPDLDLDANGTAELNFGPRRFFVGFDELLKPYVTDADGARLQDLPKPNSKDDPALADAAVDRFKTLKKDAKAIAGLQVSRLERAMCHQRRWTVPLFRKVFMDHPLMRHLARRLVWSVYRDGDWSDAFRVAEDLSLADRRDELFELPEDAAIGVVHPLELPEDIARDFGQIFGDYEILQPFRQLGRETYRLTDDERAGDCIERLKERKVASGSLLGLGNRGWEKADTESGCVSSFVRRFHDGLIAVLRFEPGIPLEDPSYRPVQSEIRIFVRDEDGNPVRLGDLSAIAASELIRDGDLLAPLK